MERHVALPASPAAAAQARAAVRSAVRAWRMEASLDDALLIASELATNAVRYGSAPIELHLAQEGDTLVIAVKDGQPSDLPYPRTLTKTEPTGRGMHLVAATCDRWGWDRGQTSKVVWAEIRTAPPG